MKLKINTRVTAHMATLRGGWCMAYLYRTLTRDRRRNAPSTYRWEWRVRAKAGRRWKIAGRDWTALRALRAAVAAGYCA